MKTKKSLFAILSILLLCVTLCLAGCGRGNGRDGNISPGQAAQPQGAAVEDGSQPNPQPQSSRPTEEGWLMSRVDMPVKMPAYVGMDSDGDQLWLSGCCEIDGEYKLVLLGLDTLSGQWQQFNLGRAELGVGMEYDLATASAYQLSVKDGMAWMCVECSSPDRAFIATKLVTVDTATGEISTAPWDESALYQSSGYTIALAAIGADGAVVVGNGEACIIDRSANIQARANLNAEQFSGCCEIGGQIYLKSYDGIAPFDAAGLSIGQTLVLGNGIDDITAASSQPGNILYSAGGKLYSAASGQGAPVFDWMDVALSRDTMAPYDLFENSKGDLYGYAAEAKGTKLVKVSRAQIPIKDTLTMACFFDTQSANGQTRMTGDMTDAILGFNNSDADYRVEPVYFEYAGSGDLSRALIEAFNAEIDLVDQSNLPEGSISGSQLLDMLPYLDTDAELRREDFFPAALQGMTWGGHMYRVSPYYSAMGLSVPAGLYPGAEGWSCEFVRQTIANDPSLALGMGKNRTPDYVVKAMAHAITAEFIDLGSMSCDFTRPDFAQWLGLTASLIGDARLAGDRINFSCDIDEYYFNRAVEAYVNALYGGFGAAQAANDIVGFPNSKGSGFYLASPAAVTAIEGEYKGMNTSVSIAGGCKDAEAAWRFVKGLIKNADTGIPVLRAAFDEVMDYNARAYNMPQADIDSLRSIAENAAGTVISDPALIQLITGELNAYISGGKTAEDVATQLQSRVSLYLTERG